MKDYTYLYGWVIPLIGDDEHRAHDVSKHIIECLSNVARERYK